MHFTEEELQQHEARIINKALAEKDALIERLKALSWNENVQFIAEAKENLLQQYCNLQILYGGQKHKIRDLEKSYQQLMEKAVRFAEAYRNAHLSNWIDLVSEDRAEEMAAKDPVFAEAQAFLKERENEQKCSQSPKDPIS